MEVGLRRLSREGEVGKGSECFRRVKDGGEWFIKFHGVFMGGLNDGEGGGWRRRDEEYINFSEISLVSGFVSQSSGGLAVPNFA